MPAASRLTTLGMAASRVVVAGVVRPDLFDWLVLDRASVQTGELWRLWTGHLAHVDTAHMTLNLAAAAILAAIAARLRVLMPLAWSTLALMPVVSLGLLLWRPGLDWYAGFSGMLHGWAVALLLVRGGTPAVIGLTSIALKLGWETIHGSTTGDALPVITEAHRLGAVAFALPALWWRGRTQPRTASADDTASDSRHLP